MDVVAQQRHHRLARSLGRHDDEVQVGARLEQLGGEVLRRARGDGADVELARLGLRGLHPVGQRLVGRACVDDEQAIEGADAGDRREILHRVERQALEQRGADGVAVGDQRKGVAVIAAGERGAGRCDAARARHVLHHEALAELFAELLRDEARGNVGDATRAERQDEPDRPGRVRLRLREAGGQHGDQRRERQRLADVAAGGLCRARTLVFHDRSFTTWNRRRGFISVRRPITRSRPALPSC